MILLILIAAFLIRLISLNQSFWLDEATSGLVVRNLGFSEIITKFAPADFHPPLYYILLKVWSGFFGTTEIGLRLFSVLVGVATIYIVYLISKNIFSKRVGVVSALLLATSGLHIYYSQEARMYSLETFFTVLAIYFFTKVEEGRRYSWILFSLTLPLIFFTDYLPLTVLTIFWLYGFLVRKKFTWWRSFILSQVSLVVAATIWLPFFLRQLQKGLSVKDSNWWNILGRTTFKEILLIPAKFIIGRISVENKIVYPLLLGILFLIFAFLIFKSLKNINKKEQRIIAFWLFLPIVVTMLVGLFIPVLSYFRLLFVLPALYILVSVGIYRLDNKWLIPTVGLVLLINIVTAGTYLLNSKFHREDWRGLVNYIESNRVKESQVLFVANSQMEGYKYYRNDAKIGGPENLDKNSHEIWLIRYVKDLFDPSDNLLGEVENLGFERMIDYNFNSIEVLKYERH